MEIELNNFKRKEEFEYYNGKENPFIILTIKLDITNIVNYCTINSNFNATMGYVIGKAVNETDGFKYRYINEKIYYYDKINTSYTQRNNKGKVCYLDCEMKDTYEEYIKEYNNLKEKFKKINESIATEEENMIWYSSTPWFSYTSLIPPIDKSKSIPQFIWDKYEKEEDNYYCHLMIMVHHGFVDGETIGELIEKIKNNISKF